MLQHFAWIGPFMCVSDRYVAVLDRNIDVLQKTADELSEKTGNKVLYISAFLCRQPCAGPESHRIGCIHLLCGWHKDT